LNQAFLICDHWSPIYQIGEDVTDYNVIIELEKNHFPYLIQQAMQGIMGNQKTSCWNLRQNLITKAFENQEYDEREYKSQYYELINLISEIKSQSVSGSLDKMKNHYSRKLMKKINEFKIITIHSPIGILLQNHSESWTHVKLIATQEFSSISSTNANKLILLLEHGHRLRRNLPILHRICEFNFNSLNFLILE
jgi:hypothetical protein